MTMDEIKAFIAEKVSEGLTLSRIQDLLKERDVKMTFMELRLIASELESAVWKKQEPSPAPAPEKAPVPEKADAADEVPDDAQSVPEEEPWGEEQEETITPPAEGAPAEAEKKLRGKTTVSLSPIQRPGYVASGSVSFGSGVTAEWFLDQTGRLGLDAVKGGKPDQQDIMEFQKELQKAFGA